MRPIAAATLCALAVAACDSIAPAPPGHAIAASPAAPAQNEPPRPLTQTDIHGTVTAAGAPSGKIVVVATDGPCFAVGSHYIGWTAARDGVPFSMQLFPPRGTRLDVCAALFVSDNRTTPWHARSTRAPLVDASDGRAVFDGVDVTLARAEPVTLPTTIPLQ
jgi:hypothetical protein